MAKVLITGKSGFLGSHLIQELKEHTIIPFARELLHNLTDLTGYIKKTKPDYIYHLAAYGNNMKNTQKDRDIFEVNTLGLFNLLEASKESNYQAFINISTSSVLLPYQTMYAATKASGEKLCRSFALKYDLPIVSMRPFSLYGENDHHGHFIPTVFRSCLYGEEMQLARSPVHDWIYVKDFVTAILRNKEQAGFYKGEAVNVGTGVATYNWEIVTMIEELTGKKATITGVFPDRDYDNDEWVCRSNLGYVDWAETKIMHGLQKVFNSYKL